MFASRPLFLFVSPKSQNRTTKQKKNKKKYPKPSCISIRWNPNFFLFCVDFVRFYFFYSLYFKCNRHCLRRASINIFCSNRGWHFNYSMTQCSSQKLDCILITWLGYGICQQQLNSSDCMQFQLVFGFFFSMHRPKTSADTINVEHELFFYFMYVCV